MAYGSLGWAILWLPLALYAVEKFFNNSSWAGPLLSFSLIFSLFSGHFQTSLYLLLKIFIYIFFRGRQLGHFKHMFYLFIFYILGVFIASPQIFPTIEFYQQSIRSQNFFIKEAIPWKYLVTLLAPDFLAIR